MQIWEWVRDFSSATKATGQLCFDFMKDEDNGKLYAIECNPRCSSIFLNFYNHSNVADAFFKPQACTATRDRTPHACHCRRSYFKSADGHVPLAFLQVVMASHCCILFIYVLIVKQSARVFILPDCTVSQKWPCGN